MDTIKNIGFDLHVVMSSSKGGIIRDVHSAFDDMRGVYVLKNGETYLEFEVDRKNFAYILMFDIMRMQRIFNDLTVHLMIEVYNTAEQLSPTTTLTSCLLDNFRDNKFVKYINNFLSVYDAIAWH